MAMFLFFGALIWLLVGLFKPKMVAPFFSTKPRLKILGTSIVIMCVGIWLTGDTPATKPKETATTTKVETKKESEKETKKADVEAKSENTHKIGEVVKTKEFEFVVLNREILPQWIDEYGAEHQKPQGVYVVVTLKYKNISNNPVKLEGNEIGMVAGKNSYAYSYRIDHANQDYLDLVNPGVENVKKLYFDVPQDVANSKALHFVIGGSALSRTKDQYITLNP